MLWKKSLKGEKPILCLDFDGVIHKHISGWKGPRNIPDPPVKGAIGFLEEAVDTFDVQIYSSRSNYIFGRYFMKRWLLRHLTDYFDDQLFDPRISSKSAAMSVYKKIKWPLKKPPALLTIDDRGFQFKGTFPSIELIKNFKPWYK